ncbi:MAG: phosphotransferase [Lactococcus sp.]
MTAFEQFFGEKMLSFISEKTINTGFAGKVIEAIDENGKYYIKKSYSNHSIINEWRILERLYFTNFPVARPTEYLPHENAIIYEKIEGELLTEKTTPDLEYSFANLLANLHQYKISEETNFVSAELAEIRKILNINEILYFNEDLERLEKTQVASREKVIVHRDFHP